MNFKALSMPLIASILILELMLLIVAPLAYCALLLPKSVEGPPFNASSNASEIPAIGLALSNSQIKAAWPHLPTAQEIVDGNYSSLRTSYSSMAQNQTFLGVSDAYSGPHGAYICYDIWLQLNSTLWIQVPYNFLSTSNPPYPQYVQAPSRGFLNTGLPTTYAAMTIAAIIVTLLAGAGYLLHKKRLLKTGVGNCGFA